MPLPFILGGAAALVGLAGVALAVDGMDNKEKAEKTLEEAKTRYKKSKQRLESEQEYTYNHLESLGEQYIEIARDFEKFEIIVDELLDRLDINKDKHLTLNLPEYKLNQIKALTVNFNSTATNIAGGAAAGALAGFAAYSGVMAFGTASTGTAIAGLSGAAASNATLAALGGGSLAAGGFGIAGGMAVLGGVVAAPALAFMGWAYSSETEDALNKAQEGLKEVTLFEEKAETAVEYLDKMYWYIDEIISGVRDIYEQFQHYYDDLEHVSELIASNKVDILKEKEHLIVSIQNGYALAAILTNIMTTPIFKIKENSAYVNIYNLAKSRKSRAFPKLTHLTSEALLDALDITDDHPDYYELESAMDALVDLLDEAKSELEDDLENSKEYLGNSVSLDDDIYAAIDGQKELRQDESLDYASNYTFFEAITAVNEEEFEDAIDELDDDLEDMDRDDIMVLVAEIRDNIKHLVIPMAQKGIEEDKEDAIDTFKDNLESAIEKVFEYEYEELEAITQKDIELIQELVLEHITHYTDTIYPYSSLESSNLIFEQVDGMNMLNEDEMSEILASAEEASAQYA